MAIITRDAQFGWNVKLQGLPATWFGDRDAAVRFVASVDAMRYIAAP